MSESGRHALDPRELARRAVAPHRPVLALALLAMALYLPSVWLRDPWNPDEPRYAEVAREMVSRGDYVLPHLNGEVYGEKPPLFFWLGILAGGLPGVPFESGTRLVSALAALLTLLLTYNMGRRLIDEQAGWLAALVLATSSMFILHATSGVIDGTLTLIVTAAIASGLRAREEGSPVLWALFYLLMGLAVITKGPVGFVIPAGVLLLTAFQEEGARGLRALHPAWGILIVAGVAALWLAPAISRGGREYAEVILFKQNVGRAYESWHHKEPAQFFLKVFPVSFAPWIVLVPSAVYGAWKARGSQKGERVALTWFAFTFLFFSMISGKKTRYLLPLFPAASLLTALEMRAFLSDSARRWRGLIPVGLAAAALLAGGLALAAAPFGYGAGLVGRLEGLAPDQRESLLALAAFPGGLALTVPGLVIAALGGWGLALLARDRGAALGFTLSACLAAVAWSQWVAVPVLDSVKSARPLADAIATVAGGDAPVLLYRESFAGVFNLHLRRDAIPVVSGRRRVQAFLDGHPGAVVIGSAADVERLRSRIPALKAFHCRMIGDVPVCAARAGA
ncbi:MAG TPA: glycosyltransferase family 39 protein [Candidatus Polarisedimenticolia bacterium]|jgi:4-amino-4-deoxy-L-arabinose transferase-like glycosyltransferase